MNTRALPWCFIGTRADNCAGAGPLWTCPDSHVVAGPGTICHAAVAAPISVPHAGADVPWTGLGLLAMGASLLLAGVRGRRR